MKPTPVGLAKTRRTLKDQTSGRPMQLDLAGLCPLGAEIEGFLAKCVGFLVAQSCPVQSNPGECPRQKIWLRFRPHFSKSSLDMRFHVTGVSFWYILNVKLFSLQSTNMIRLVFNESYIGVAFSAPSKLLDRWHFPFLAARLAFSQESACS